MQFDVHDDGDAHAREINRAGAHAAVVFSCNVFVRACVNVVIFGVGAVPNAVLERRTVCFFRRWSVTSCYRLRD